MRKTNCYKKEIFLAKTERDIIASSFLSPTTCACIHRNCLFLSVFKQSSLLRTWGVGCQYLLDAVKGTSGRGRWGDECVNDFTGQQESVTESRQEVVGGISTGKKGCHGEYVEVTTCATGQK